jgi:hypothetical protein
MALPADYVGFWIVVGVVTYLLYLIGQAPIWVLLWMILKCCERLPARPVK